MNSLHLMILALASLLCLGGLPAGCSTHPPAATVRPVPEPEIAVGSHWRFRGLLPSLPTAEGQRLNWFTVQAADPEWVLATMGKETVPTRWPRTQFLQDFTRLQ